MAHDGPGTVTFNAPPQDEAQYRSAGISFEDRQDLLGHVSSRMTTHYSAAEPSRLIEAANSVCDVDGKKPELVALRGALRDYPHKIPASIGPESEREGATR